MTAAQDVFVFGSDDTSAANKKHWLDPLVDRFDIPGNEPLVKLLREYAVLLIKNKGSKVTEPERLTYDVVLDLFDKVLASPGWPERDFIPCKWFDARAGGVIPGVTSDNHKDDPIPAPSFVVSKSAPQRSDAEMMPPPPPPTASTSGYRLRSGSKRSNAAVDNQQTLPSAGEPSTSSHGERSSKRHKGSGTTIRSSSATHSNRRGRGSRGGSRSRGSAKTAS